MSYEDRDETTLVRRAAQEVPESYDKNPPAGPLGACKARYERIMITCVSLICFYACRMISHLIEAIK